MEISLVLSRDARRDGAEEVGRVARVAAVVVAQLEEKKALEVALGTAGTPVEVEPFSNANAICKAERRIFRVELCSF